MNPSTLPDSYYWLVTLEVVAGYVALGFIAVIALVVVWKIFKGQIDISKILYEKDATSPDPNAGPQAPAASMARFQLLIFVFVIAISFFMVVVSNIKIVQARSDVRDLPKLPEVPNGVMALLGISASSYAVGKAIQNGTGTQ
jgi:hypothetical protein